MKKELRFFSNYEVDAMKNYFEKKALKGWLLQKKDGNCYYFKKTAPCKLHFWVFISDEKVVDKYSRYIQNSEPQKPVKKTANSDDGHNLFYDISEDLYDKRWKYICTDDNINICYSEREACYPRYTDSNETIKLLKKETIYRCCSIIAILIYSLFFFLFCYQLGDVIGVYSLFIAAFFTLSLFIWTFGKLLEIIYWNIKEKDKLTFYEEKIPLIYGHKIRVGLIFIFYVIVILVAIAGLLVNDSELELVTALFFLLPITIYILKRCVKKQSVKNIFVYVVKGLFFDIIKYLVALTLLLFICVIVSDLYYTSKTREYTDNNNNCYQINNDDIPITLDDIGIETNDGFGTKYEHSETIFSQADTFSNEFEATDGDNSCDDYLYVSIYKGNSKTIQSFIENYNLSINGPSIKDNYSEWYSPITDVYSYSDWYHKTFCNNYYILTFEDKLVGVESNNTLSCEQLNIIAKKIDDF